MSETANCIRLGFVGDVCLADNYTPVIALAEIGSTDVTDGVDARFVNLMHDMDLMWANNEFCYSDRGERMPNKQFAFRAKTANVRYLADLGVNIAGLANNHVFDYGEQAFLDTLETLEGAGIPYVGAGRDLAAAQTPVDLQASGLTVAYVAASRAERFRLTPEATDTTPGILLCYDNSRFVASIREAAAHADYVVALPHWGIERATDLQDEQTHGARAYIDAGADAVIGTHAHCLQGIEFYEGKPILYNLGNFWFDGFKGLTALAELQLPLAAGDSGRDRRAGKDGRAGRDGHGERNGRFERSEQDARDGRDGRAGRGGHGERDGRFARSGQDERCGQGRRGIDTSGVRLVLYPGWQQMAITSWIDAPADRANAFRYIEDISVNVTIDEAGFVSEA